MKYTIMSGSQFSVGTRPKNNDSSHFPKNLFGRKPILDFWQIWIFRHIFRDSVEVFSCLRLGFWRYGFRIAKNIFIYRNIAWTAHLYTLWKWNGNGYDIVRNNKEVQVTSLESQIYIDRITTHLNKSYFNASIQIYPLSLWYIRFHIILHSYTHFFFVVCAEDTCNV